jgi:type I restriction enzyme M protein
MVHRPKIDPSSAKISKKHADTFRRDLRAGYVVTNPHFNSDWCHKDEDVCWQFGVLPKGYANFAWVPHFIHHLVPQGMGTLI